VGKLADLALWRVDGLGQAAGVDPVWTFAFGSSTPLQLLLVNGAQVVQDGELSTADSTELVRDLTAASRKVLDG